MDGSGGEARLERPPVGIATSGAAIVAQFLAQLGVGIVLGRTYVATPGSAYPSTEGLPDFLRAFHYWGSAVLILHCLGHLAACLWTGRTSGPWRRRYLASIGFFACAFGFQITGNLLPWDRHGVQSAAIEGTIAARIPGIGPAIKRAMLGGDLPSSDTLLLWYAVHRFLLPALFFLALVAAVSEWRARKDVRISPWGAVGALGAVATLAFSIPAPLASRATSEDAVRYDALASWYTWAAHGSLVMWDRIGGLGWFGASGMLGIIALGTIAAAFLPKGYGRGWLLVAGGYLAVCAFGFGGRFAPLTGRRDPPTAPKVADRAKTEAVAPQDARLAALGAKIFERENCSGCHGAKGNAAIAGPSLKDIGKRHPDRGWYATYIRNPQSVKPGSVMPAYPKLTPEELNALGEYLRFPRP